MLFSFCFLTSSRISSDGSALTTGAPASDMLSMTASETPMVLENNNLLAEPNFKIIIASLPPCTGLFWAIGKSHS